MNQKAASSLLGLLGLVLMITVAALIKEKDINEAVGAQNLEATYHALLTIEALRNNGVHDHWFLPTVTLGQQSDAFISWGATIPTKSGDYIYTSFTPPGFLLPYVAFEIFDLQATIKSIGRFNMAVGVIVAGALYLLIVKLLLHSGASTQLATIAALIGVSIAHFSREALLSTGIIYWPHELYQLLFVASLNLLFNLLKCGVNNRAGFLSQALLLLLLFLGAWTEWTGYIFNLGVAIIIWFLSDKRGLRKVALKVIVVTVAAGVFTLSHYGFAVGFNESVNAFIGRFYARSAQRGSILELVAGYELSYGMFFLPLLIIVIRKYFVWQTVRKLPAVISLVLLASFIPLVENLVLLQHATQFSFDRLKFIIPSAIVIAFGFWDRRIWFRLLVLSLIAFASAHGYWSYKIDMESYAEWASHHEANKALIGRLKNEVDFKCATFASNLGVRGYTNLLLDRSVYEYKTLDQAISLNIARGGCASIFLEGRWFLPDLPRYRLAVEVST